VLERERRDDGQQHGKSGALAANLTGELAAALALLDVMAQLTATQRASTHNGELLADLSATGSAPQAPVHE
jgi:hypothetical protein